jgi:protocatechuate 3,4-dioxygenase beta subunit
MAEGDHRERRSLLNRREAIAGAGAGALAIGAALYVLLRDDGENGDGTAGSTTGAASETGRCVLTPEQTEGPYYIEDALVRSDIREGKAGAPLELRLTAEDASSCEPIENATVEVWHCDALGAYSGFDAPDEKTFLRGAQRSDRRGEVAFQTVYPGWYQGRTTHIHVKVHVGGQTVHTGQLYFDDAVTRSVYRQAPYASRGEPTTTNASDGIYASGGRQSTLEVSRAGRGYVGRLALGVTT